MTQKRFHPGTFSQLVAECQRIDEMQVQSRDDFIHDIILFLLQIFLGIMGVQPIDDLIAFAGRHFPEAPVWVDQAGLSADGAHAALDAERVLAETGDARRSDLLVDAACFARQLELAQASGCQILADYVRALIDGANLKSLVRTLRLKKDAAFLRELLLPGGTVSPERIVQHGFSSSAAELFAGSALAQAAQAAEAAAAGGSLTELERLCDNAALNVIGRARRVPFGVEVPVGYVAARENELMSVRLVITGLLAGIPADQIRERLRETNG